MVSLNGMKDTATALNTTWRLHFIALLWLPAVGFAAYGLSTFAPEGEAAGGVVLAAIALGAYRISSWALDVLAPMFVETLVWPLLGNRRQPAGFESPAFTSAFRMLHSSGRDIHFSRRHPLEGGLESVEKELEKVRRTLEKLEATSSNGKRKWVSLTPRRHIRLDRMLDVSEAMSEHSLDVEDLRGVLFEMPDGSYWEVPHYAGTTSGLDGVEGSRFILMRRVR